MPVYKLKRGGKVVSWWYQFGLAGATRADRRIVKQGGFATQKAAIDAEAERRLEEMKKQQIAKAGAVGVTADLPKTLEMLLQEFLERHAEPKLAPKTVERYRDHAAVLSPELRAMPLAEITPLHLNREWTRLLQCGGHTRKTKTPRPMKAKTVRHIAAFVSSAFSRAIRWGLVATNPATNSEPPVPRKHFGVALTPTQQDLLINSSSGPWCMKTFLIVCAASACRRGEVLALRWSDIQGGIALIARSLMQTRHLLEFKCDKTDNPRPVALDEQTLLALEAHRKCQDEYRAHFGPTYRADLDLIFANPDGTPFKPNSISASVSLICRKLKLPKGASLHSLRHTHASFLLAEGVPLPVVSARLGHSSMRTTADIYVHMINGQDRDAARSWAEFNRRNLAATAPAQTDQVQ